MPGHQSEGSIPVQRQRLRLLITGAASKVYVTGFVRNPGLYGGVTSDSLLNYLIKAGGVDPERGSYVDIVVKRGNRVRSNVNLYDFLLNGKLGLSQFADGDTIIVGPRQHTFSVQGDVFNSYDFEFRESSIPVTEALSWARPKLARLTLRLCVNRGCKNAANTIRSVLRQAVCCRTAIP